MTAILHETVPVASWLNKLLQPKMSPDYALPKHILPHSAVDQYAPPCHAGILEVIRDAKNHGHLWAEGALIQLGYLTGKNYVFKRHAGLGSERFEIEVQP